jgi:transcriptional regulator GlxA family with amidase domain
MPHTNNRDAYVPSQATVADDKVAVRLIQDSGYSKAGLQKTAGSVYLSVSRLSHLFKQEVGLSPLEYAKSLKLKTAKHLIEDSHAPIKEIAAIVGYKEFKAFIRDFKAAYGFTPKTYRNRHRAERAAVAETDLQA